MTDINQWPKIVDLVREIVNEIDAYVDYDIDEDNAIFAVITCDERDDLIGEYTLGILQKIRRQLDKSLDYKVTHLRLSPAERLKLASVRKGVGKAIKRYEDVLASM